MIFLLAALFALATADAVYTTKMLSTHGLGIELNPLIHLLSGKLGLKAGIWTGIMVPTAAFAALATFLPAVLAVLIPARCWLLGMQLHKLAQDKRGIAA